MISDDDEYGSDNNEDLVEMRTGTTVTHDPNDVTMVTEENSSITHQTTTRISTDNSEQESSDENGMFFYQVSMSNICKWITTCNCVIVSPNYSNTDIFMFTNYHEKCLKLHEWKHRLRCEPSVFILFQEVTLNIMM